jgi:UDP:flavonoid glycosyltransferase YjiC (YdhE family)
MSSAGLGHVYPMMPLAFALQRRGHDVRWLTGPDACDRLRDVGIRADPVGIAFEDLRAEYRRLFPAESTTSTGPSERPDHLFPHQFGGLATSHVLDAAVRIATDWTPALVVHDAADFAGPIVARLAGVPSVTHAFGALTPIWRVEAAATQAAPAWRSVGLEPRRFGGLYDHLYLDIYPASLQVADMSHVPRRQPIRSDAFTPALRGSTAVHAPHADDAPLVYLTFGTVDRERPIFPVAIAAIAALPVRLLVTVGPRGDPAAFEPQPGNVRIERFVPQAEVLSGCAVMVSHAGSGTFLGALREGIPQLCLPQAADQFLNAAACQRSGVGLSLESAAATGPAIGEAVKRLLVEPGFRERAVAAAAEMAAMPSPDDVVPILERLAIDS